MTLIFGFIILILILFAGTFVVVLALSSNKRAKTIRKIDPETGKESLEIHEQAGANSGQVAARITLFTIFGGCGLIILAVALIIGGSVAVNKYYIEPKAAKEAEDAALRHEQHAADVKTWKATWEKEPMPDSLAAFQQKVKSLPKEQQFNYEVFFLDQLVPTLPDTQEVAAGNSRQFFEETKGRTWGKEYGGNLSYAHRSWNTYWTDSKITAEPLNTDKLTFIGGTPDAFVIQATKTSGEKNSKTLTFVRYGDGIVIWHNFLQLKPAAILLPRPD